MEFQQGEVQNSAPGEEQLQHQYMLGIVQLERSLARKDLAVPVNRLNTCQLCALATKKVNGLH